MGNNWDMPSDDQIVAAVNVYKKYFETEFDLPNSYIDHLKENCGAIPGLPMFDVGKMVRVVCRWVSVWDGADIKPMAESWRQWSSQDIQLDYSIKTFVNFETWCAPMDEHLLLPIAVLDTAGHNARLMDVFDLLCFDISDAKLSAVIWSPFDFNRLVLVSDSWDSFKKKLYIDENSPSYHIFTEPDLHSDAVYF